MVTTNEDAIQQLKNNITYKLGKLILDVDFEESIKKFVTMGGYEFNKSFAHNLKSCLQFIAIKKAKNK